MRRTRALGLLLLAGCAPQELPLPPADPHLVTVERGEVLCVDARRADVVLGFSNDRVRRWSFPGDRFADEGKGHRRGVTCIAQDHRGRVITGGPDRSVRVWSPELEQELELRGPTRPLACVGLRPDGAAVAASMAGELFVWDATSGERRFDRDGPAQRGVMCLTLDRLAERLAWAADGGNLRVWDTTTGDKLAGMRVDGLGFVAAIALAEDGRVATGDRDKGRVALWDPAQEALLTECSGVAGPVRALAFEQSGVRLAVASEDGTLQLFDSRTGRELRRWQVAQSHPRRLSFDGTGQRLVAAGPGSTWTWIDTRSVPAPDDVVVGVPLDAPILRDVDEAPPTYPEDGRIPMARLAVSGYDPPELRSDPTPWTVEDFPDRVQVLAGRRIVTAGYPLATERIDGGKLRCLLSRFPPGCCFGSFPVADEWIEVTLDGADGLDPNSPLEVEGVLDVGEVIDDLGFVESMYRMVADRASPPR